MKSAIKYFIIASAVCSSAASSIACAESAPTKLVGYSDLNLDSAEGARALYARLRQASREVCAGFEGSESMQRRIDWERCYSTALSGAVTLVHSAALSSLYEKAQAR